MQLFRRLGPAFSKSLHVRREPPKEAPIDAVSIEPFPEMIAARTKQHVIAKHVMRDLFPYQLRVNHKGDFFQEPHKIALLLDADISHLRVIGCQHIEYFSVLRSFQKTPAHLDEVSGARLVSLSHIFERAKEEPDQRDEAAENDGNIFGNRKGGVHDLKPKNIDRARVTPVDPEPLSANRYLPTDYRVPRTACSRSIDSNSALKLPLPKLFAPLRWMIS